MIFAVIKLQPKVETGYSCVIIAVEIFIKLLYKRVFIQALAFNIDWLP